MVGPTHSQDIVWAPCFPEHGAEFIPTGRFADDRHLPDPMLAEEESAEQVRHSMWRPLEQASGTTENRVEAVRLGARVSATPAERLGGETVGRRQRVVGEVSGGVR